MSEYAKVYEEVSRFNELYTKFCMHLTYPIYLMGVRGGAVGLDAELHAGRSRVRFPSGRNTALRSTQPLKK